MVKQSGGKRCEDCTTRRFGSWLHDKKCTDALIRRKVTIPVTVHDKISNLRQRGAGGRQLRHELELDLGRSTAKKAFMTQKWGEWSNSNSKDAINPQG